MFYPLLIVKIRKITEAVYSQLGPGLPDKVYKESFIRELEEAGIYYEKDSFIPIDYKGQILESGINACFIIDKRIVLYIKSSSKKNDYYKKQLNNFMRLSSKKCGMILDFNSDELLSVMKVFMSAAL